MTTPALAALATRNGKLALVAVVLVLLLAWDRLGPGPRATPRRAAEQAPGATAPVGSAAPIGAPRGLERAELARRYAPVLAAKPFVPRAFRDPPPPRSSPPPRRPGRGGGDAPERAPEPEQLELRLTGFVGGGAGRTGVLERFGTGQGLLVQTGQVVAGISVAAVGSESVTVREAERERTVALGDSLSLPLSAQSALVPLAPAAPRDGAPVSGAGGPAGVTVTAPAIDDEERKRILEQMRARRRQSLEGGGK